MTDLFIYIVEIDCFRLMTSPMQYDRISTHHYASYIFCFPYRECRWQDQARQDQRTVFSTRYRQSITSQWNQPIGGALWGAHKRVESNKTEAEI